MASRAHTLVYRPSLRERLAHYARVLRVIAGTEWRLKYADSVLGYAWSLLKPLALFGVLYIVFGRLFDIPLGFNHYPLYLLLGLVLWFFFVDASSLALTSIVSLLGDRERLAAMRRSGRAHVAREHSPARFRDLLAEAFREVDALA